MKLRKLLLITLGASILFVTSLFQVPFVRNGVGSVFGILKTQEYSVAYAQEQIEILGSVDYYSADKIEKLEELKLYLLKIKAKKYED